MFSVPASSLFEHEQVRGNLMNMMTTLNLRAMVINDNGEAKTTSYAVAEAFENDILMYLDQ